jgi:hypothetical protein
VLPSFLGLPLNATTFKVHHCSVVGAAWNKKLAAAEVTQLMYETVQVTFWFV